MVKKLLSFVTQEVGGLHEAAYILGAFALLSQILALIRDRLLAYTFGASHALDLYYAAFRIPDFIFASVASVVSISIIIPFLMERLDKGQHEAKEFLDNVFSVFFLIIGLTALVAYIFTPALISIFFPTFKADYPTLIAMTRIMLFSPIFLGFSNFLASVTQIYKRFYIYALSPIVYNAGIIFGTIVLYPIFGIEGLAWGVAVGAFLHFFIQVPFIWKKALFPEFRFHIDFASVKKVYLISLPRTITVSSNEIAEFFLVSMASLLSGGAISIFNFSWNLQSVPMSIIGVSYSLAAFPVLTKLFSLGDTKKFVEHMVTSTKHMIFWSLPIMTLFVVLRAQIVRVILGSGQFNWADTRLTAAALALFTFSLIPQNLVMLFVRAYYSRGNTKRPLLMNMVSAALIIFCSYFFIHFFNNIPVFRFFIESLFRVDDIPGSAILMLPLGFSVGATINLILHWIAFEKDFPGYSKPVFASGIQVFSASMIMGFVSYGLLNVFAGFFNINNFFGIFLQGFCAGMIGIFVCLGILILFKNKELADIYKAFHKKIWKVKIIPADSVEPRG